MSDFWIGGAYGHAYIKEIEQLKRAQRRAVRSRGRTRGALDAELESLRGDVEFLSLLVGSIFARLDERGEVTREDLRGLMMAVDECDGELDGRLQVDALRELVKPYDDLDPAL